MKVFKFIPEWKLLWSCYSSDDVFVTDLSAQDMTAVSLQLLYLDLKKRSVRAVKGFQFYSLLINFRQNLFTL